MAILELGVIRVVMPHQASSFVSSTFLFLALVLTTCTTWPDEILDLSRSDVVKGLPTPRPMSNLAEYSDVSSLVEPYPMCLKIGAVTWEG